MPQAIEIRLKVDKVVEEFCLVLQVPFNDDSDKRSVPPSFSYLLIPAYSFTRSTSAKLSNRLRMLCGITLLWLIRVMMR
ncbi:hypothetical protein DPMN_186570 [Dreissena polymorpha]|uniref:Uncharacterized protein n=1 Tax=Dreissena polymorpha TaxID=45954 RepID=A0A9D4I9P4_DREPO|nr:hypothetical protein DPMN_186570 [Dreissena polymorpha]